MSCVLVIISSVILNIRGESKHPGLVLNLRKKVFSVSPLSMMLAVAFHRFFFSQIQNCLTLKFAEKLGIEFCRKCSFEIEVLLW